MSNPSHTPLETHVLVWQFRVRLTRQDEFLEAYNPAGSWAELFRRDEGYIRSELLQDRREANVYLTLDYWKSESQYTAFRERWQEAYEALDRACVELTEEERFLGHYILVRGPAR